MVLTMPRKAERKKDRTTMSDDRISNLPWDVLDTILVRIPLKEAVRTSVLSTKWRHNWARLSQFAIEDKMFPGTLDVELRWDEIKNILDQVRLNNTGGPIERFKLAAYCHPDPLFLQRWARFLFGKGLKEFIIRTFSSPVRFKLPLHTFTCRKLTRLELFGCWLNIPRNHDFEGFVNLASLTLDSVSVGALTLERLVSKCSNLESLTLLDLDFFITLTLHGTKLRYLKIASIFYDMCLYNSPILETVDVQLKNPRISFPKHPDSNLVRIIGCLQGVKRLTLNKECVGFLAERNVPERLPLLENLRVLELKEAKPNSLNHVKVCLCLLKSTPNLEELHISVDEAFGSWKSVIDFLKAQSPLGLYFNRLRVFKFRGVWEIIFALHFFKVVLANSPVLETMTVICFGAEKIPDEQFDQLERASQHVKILSLATAYR